MLIRGNRWAVIDYTDSPDATVKKGLTYSQALRRLDMLNQQGRTIVAMVRDKSF